MVSYKVLTLFPDYIKNYLAFSPHYKRGVEKNILTVDTIQIRNYAKDKHKKVDDTLYSGGPGLLLKPDVLVEAIEDNADNQTTVIMLDPKGEMYTQELAAELVQHKKITLVCGRYEGFDARIQKIIKPRLISIGDYILTNGEIGALVLLDSIIRLHPGTCDDDQSTVEDSFSNGLLEYDQYTRPFKFRGETVPEVLLSGHHQKIQDWKIKNSIKNTIKSRPELLKKVNLNNIDLSILREVIKEISHEHR